MEWIEKGELWSSSTAEHTLGILRGIVGYETRRHVLSTVYSVECTLCTYWALCSRSLASSQIIFPETISGQRTY